MTYKWKSGACISVSADVAGEVCESLAEKNALTAHNLVDVSRPDDAPLHGAFEWNDSVAAEKYRENQARHIINCIVTVKDTETPVRAFFNITSLGSEYQKTEVLISEKDTRAGLLEQALRELAWFQKKYECLAELADIFEAIDAARKEAGVA